MSEFKYFNYFISLFLLFSVSLLPLAAEKKATPHGLVYFYGYPFNTTDEIQTIANTPYIHRAEISIEWKDVFNSRNEFDWSLIDKNIEIWKKAGKSVILRIMTANNATFCTSPTLIANEKIRLVSEGVFTDFEENLSSDGYTMLQGSIAGSGNKFYELESNKLKDIQLLQLAPQHKLTPKASYLFQCDVKGLRKINSSQPATVSILLQSNTHPEQTIRVTEKIETQKNQLFSGEFTLGNYTDYTLKIEIQNAEYCQLDNLNLIQSSQSRNKRVAFPDYFSANFKKSFSYFMTEMSKRYNPNPVVDAIVISGVGRWEEMLLNDNEKPDVAVHESFYRQWRAYGYTDVNYLKNVVEWSMDLTLKLFPQKELILQISPMNNGYKNEDFIYRRAAALAVSKGISIKQNGMSEKYDTWSATSDPAYVMNRYRYYPKVKRYYETAGQIFRNTMNAMGHPESLFNRVIVDGVNNLYLYKSDILEPNVQKYFGYADSLMRKPFVSKLYSNLGFFPLANRKKQKPGLLDTISYYNKWLGIRQYDMSEASPNFVFDSALHINAASTNATNPYILFDVDDRILYNGMASAIVTVSYIDKGFDAFDVMINSRKSGKREIIATVKKNNSMILCRKSIALNDLLESADNLKETKPEICVYDLNDGFEYISGLEIEYVPLHAFETELLMQNKATKKFVSLSKNDSLSSEMNWNYNQPLAKAEINYYDGDFSAKSDLTIGLYFDNDALPVVNKQYYIGGDKEWIPLHQASPAIPKRIKLTFLNNNGTNGAYLGNNGKIAYRLSGYKTTEKSAINVDAQGLFQLSDFFHSFSFGFQPELNQLKIYKRLPDNSFHEIPFLTEKNKIYFSPQHPGYYKIEMNHSTLLPESVSCLLLK